MIHSLRDRESFVRVRRHGVRLRAETLWCSFLPDPLVTPPCVGFAIPRAMGTAVARNRLRRRLRALLRTRDMPPGEYVFGTINTTRSANTSSIRRQSTERSFEQLRHEVDQLLARLPSPEAASDQRRHGDDGG
ncbi:MAG: ribonuclease P protein component [Ilumatobacteraceae bacterium]|nr:ribonuclease P protein component [Ilumatobacteraceae bacterium]